MENANNNNFSLSFDNIKDMPFDKYEKNFTFIVNGKQYETTRYIADILSPILRKCHYIDETINQFTLKIDEKDQSSSKENDYFSEFLNLTQFSASAIDGSKRSMFIEYFIQLGNINEYLRLQPQYFEDMSPSNVIGRIEKVIGSVGQQSSAFMKAEMKDCIFDCDCMKHLIKYAAEHFSEISSEQMKELPVDVIEKIVKEEALRLDEEDVLLNFILSKYEEDDRYSILFEYVRFENVGEESLLKFINEFNIENMNAGVWRSICARLVRLKDGSKSEERYGKKGGNDSRDKENKGVKEIKYTEGKEFEGIMKYLSDKSGGNIHSNGTIEIKSNSIYGSNYPQNLVDYQSDNSYESRNNIENAMVCFDFKDKSVQISSYSLKTYNYLVNSEHLKNWVIEVSNDNNEWEIIDQHENDSRLNGPNIIYTFNTKQTSTFYRFVRLRQTGKSWDNNYYFRLYFLEFHGKLKE